MGIVIMFFVERRTSDGWERAEPLVVKGGWDVVDGHHEWVTRERRKTLLGDLPKNMCYLLLGEDGHFPQRGFPSDASRETAVEWDEVGGSNSTWLSLPELNAFDWHAELDARNVQEDEFDRCLSAMSAWADGKPETIRAVLWQI